MQHNSPPPVKKKKKSSEPRDKWRYETNAASGLRLIQKLDPDDSNYLFDVANIALSTVKNTMFSWFTKLEPIVEDPVEIALSKLSNEEIEFKVKKLTRERTDLTKAINAAKDNNTPVDANAVKRRDEIQGEILRLIFRKDKPSIALNETYAKLEDQINILRADLETVTERIDAIKAENLANKKSGIASTKKIELADLALRKQLINQIDDLIVIKINMIKENIREHARRRVDIFFLMCIAFYKMNVNITYVTKADVQLGAGSSITNTAACHAAAIKSVIITPIPPPASVTDSITSAVQTVAETAQVVASKVADASSYMYSLFSKSTDPLPKPGDEPDIEKAIPPTKAFNFVFEGSYLEELMNDTNELPVEVNNFHRIMEGTYGKMSPFTEACVVTVNKVSRGELHPFQAMSKYADMARLFYSNMDYNYFETEREKSSALYKKGAELISRYESEGTYSAFHPDSNVLRSDYIKLMLGLQTLSAGEKFATFFSYKGYVDERIEEVQKTILNAKPMRDTIIEKQEKDAAEKKGLKK